MQEDKVYFDAVKREIDSAKEEIKANKIDQEHKESKMTVVLSDVEKKLDCTKDEIFLNAKSTNASKRIVKRGEVFHCSLGVGVGSEIQKIRPCVVLSNDVSNNFSSNVVVAPITHTNKNMGCFAHIDPKYDTNNLILDGSVNTANIRTISKARLGNCITKLTTIDMKRVNESIYDTLGTMAEIKELRERLIIKEEQIQLFKSKNKEQEKLLKEIYSLIETSNFKGLKKVLENK